MGSSPRFFSYEKTPESKIPGLNVPRRHESVPTHTFFSDTHAVDSGAKQAQVFVGRDSLVAL